MDTLLGWIEIGKQRRANHVHASKSERKSFKVPSIEGKPILRETQLRPQHPGASQHRGTRKNGKGVCFKCLPKGAPSPLETLISVWRLSLRSGYQMCQTWGDTPKSDCLPLGPLKRKPIFQVPSERCHVFRQKKWGAGWGILRPSKSNSPTNPTT